MNADKETPVQLKGMEYQAAAVAAIERTIKDILGGFALFQTAIGESFAILFVLILSMIGLGGTAALVPEIHKVSADKLFDDQQVSYDTVGSSESDRAAIGSLA